MLPPRFMRLQPLYTWLLRRFALHPFTLRPFTLRHHHSILVSARDGMDIAIITTVGGDTITAAGLTGVGVTDMGGTAKSVYQLS
jgi:hypothetical protein